MRTANGSHYRIDLQDDNINYLLSLSNYHSGSTITMINGKKIEDINRDNDSTEMADLLFVVDDFRDKRYVDVDCVNANPQSIWCILDSLEKHGEIVKTDPENGIDAENNIRVFIPDLLTDKENNEDLLQLHEVSHAFVLKSIKHYIFEKNNKFYFVNYGNDSPAVPLKVGFDVDSGFYSTDVNHYDQLAVLESLQKMYLHFRLTGGLSIFNVRGYGQVSEAKMTDFSGMMFGLQPEPSTNEPPQNATEFQNRKSS